MTQETVRALSDDQLVQVIAWVQGEQKARAERRKRETIAKIKELAGTAGVLVRIQGVRGRPAKMRGGWDGARDGVAVASQHPKKS
jgi:hypothetical protein